MIEILSKDVCRGTMTSVVLRFAFFQKQIKAGETVINEAEQMQLKYVRIRSVTTVANVSILFCGNCRIQREFIYRHYN
jgi:hypothetical protein